MSPTLSQPTSIFPLIVSAGKGSRFGADIPKQYVSLFNQTILQHTVSRLAKSEFICSRTLTLVIAKDDTLAKTLDFVLPIQFTVGGEERWQSVKAGVDMIARQGAKPEDLVLIHDAVRPLVAVSDIDKLLITAQTERFGAILATPVTDTLKQANVQKNCHQMIKKTINRQGLWHAQTPQVFRLQHLQKVLHYIMEHGIMITDEVSGFEMLDMPIRLVSGSRNNIKLTYLEDLELIKHLLSIQV